MSHARLSSLLVCAALLLVSVAPARAQEPLPTAAPSLDGPCAPGEEHCADVEAAPPREPPAGWKIALASGAAVVAGYALANAVGLIAWGAVATPMLLSTARLAQDANALACLTVICVVAPLQAAFLFCSTTIASIAAPFIGWAASAIYGRRRVACAPPVLATLPTMTLAWLAASALQGGLLFGNCCFTFCGVMCFTSYLVDTWAWPNVNAEYYAMRRVGPPLFYGCFCASQLCVLGALSSGNAASAALVGAWSALSGRPLERGERVLNADILRVGPRDDDETLEQGLLDERPAPPDYEELDQELAE